MADSRTTALRLMSENPITQKWCSKCGEAKRIDEFGSSPTCCDGRDPRCLICKRAASAGYYQRWSPEQRMKHRERVLRTRYGMNIAQVEALYKKQGGRCTICGRSGDRPAVHEKRRSNAGILHVDHDHLDGSPRGLLCGQCNKMLGFAGDDVGVLTRAAAYITGHRRV